MTREYDYLNARIRGMRSRLLPPGLRAQAQEVEGVEEWLSLLAATPYIRELGPAPRGKPFPWLLEAVDRSVAGRLRRLGGLASGPPGEAAALLLAESDLRNLLVILTGLSRRIPPQETLPATLAGGTLAPDQLAALAASGTPREAADRLATWGYPFHGAFRAALGKHGERSLLEMRLDLVRNFFRILSDLSRKAASPVLTGYLASRVDQQNVLTAFMGRTLPTDRDPGEFFLPGGREVPLKVFQRLLQAPDIHSALRGIPGSFLEGALGEAALAFEVEGRASLFLQALDKAIHRRFTRPLALDPLGVSLLIAFVLDLRREALLLKLSLTRIGLGIPKESFPEVVGGV